MKYSLPHFINLCTKTNAFVCCLGINTTPTSVLKAFRLYGNSKNIKKDTKENLQLSHTMLRTLKEFVETRDGRNSIALIMACLKQNVDAINTKRHTDA